MTFSPEKCQDTFNAYSKYFTNTFLPTKETGLGEDRADDGGQGGKSIIFHALGLTTKKVFLN